MHEGTPQNRRIFSPYQHPISTVRWVSSFLLVVLLVYIWASFLRGDLRSFKVISSSMEPTLRIGDYVLTRRVHSGEQLRGRIVAFEDSQNPGEILTKRVVAVEGDAVELLDGILYINGRAEDSIFPRILRVLNRSWRVGVAEIFVVGDNRNNSVDSIDYGPIPVSQLVGVVFFRYWPLNAVGFVK